MLNKKVTIRYTKALFEIGKEKKKIGQYLEELQTFFSLFQNNTELKDFLVSPVYTNQDRCKAVAVVLDKLAISPIVTNFVLLLIEKGRILFLQDIIDCYEELTNEFEGLIKAKVITATELTNDEYQTIQKALEKTTESKVVLTTAVDPTIIGGVIAEVGDKIYDGSVKSQIQKIGETLT